VKRTPMQRGKPLKRSGRLAPKAVSRRTRLESRTRLRARAPNGVKRMAHRRVPAFLAWIRAEPCCMAGHALHVCDGPVDPCHVRTKGAGHPDLFDVVPGCRYGFHEPTEGGRRLAWEARFGLSLVALAHSYTRRWIAETGFDLDAYLAGLDANPKRAAYAAELRDAMRESAVGAHLNPKGLAA
jgi:hypothetical protein